MFPGPHLDELNSLTIRDNTGNRQTLYFSLAQDGIDIDGYELPPLPPRGVFDARFQSGRLVEVFGDGNKAKREFPISIQSAGSPLTVSWNIARPGNENFVLDIGGSAYAMSGLGNVTVGYESSTNITLRLSGDGKGTVPGSFALHQNYPNPFNPTTNFGFRIVDFGFVSFKVYDVLGREVATLVNEVKQPGEYTVTWDAAREPSGIYFYKLAAGTYTDCKKMVLIK